MILGTFFFLLAVAALLPVLLLSLSAFEGSILTRIELLVSTYSGTLLSLGTVFLVSSLAILSTRISNKSAEERERYSRRIQASLQMSEFRLKWIEELRDEIVELQAELSLSDAKTINHREVLIKFRRIFLMLNPNEDETKELKECFTEILEKNRKGQTKEKASKLRQFDKISQTILKTEWDRLKSDLEQAQDMDL